MNNRLADIAFEIQTPDIYLFDSFNDLGEGKLLSGISMHDYRNVLENFAFSPSRNYSLFRNFLDTYKVLFNDYKSIESLSNSDICEVLDDVVYELSLRSVESSNNYLTSAHLTDVLDEPKSKDLTRQLFKEEFIPYKHEKHSTCFKLN